MKNSKVCLPEVMLSVQRQWCEKIASKKKTVEVRKTRPKIQTPFKCYIYCTKENIDTCPKNIWWRKDKTGFRHIMNGKVIGEFVCDEILCFPYVEGEEAGECVYHITTEIGEQTCLDYGDVVNYGNGKTICFWHISKLIIYDKPKELSAFGLKRPPQSWCYGDRLKK